jgi:hypothetical protein
MLRGAGEEILEEEEGVEDEVPPTPNSEHSFVHFTVKVPITELHDALRQ